MSSKTICFVGLVSLAGLAHATAQEVKISGVSGSGLSKRNLCAALGGAALPPTFKVRHSKGAESITLSMVDNLSNGNTVNHGSTSVAANPSGVTTVSYSFLPPCNRRTGEGLKSAYYVTASAGVSSKTILWAKYP